MTLEELRMDSRPERNPCMTELGSEQLLVRVTAEMRHLHDSGAGMRLEIEPAVAFAVVAMVQLALRHPESQGASAEMAGGFVELVRRKFEPHAPAIAEAIRRGNDQQHDEPGQAEPEERNQIISRRIMDLRERGEPVNRVTLANELMKNGELKAVGGLTYLVTLPEAPAPEVSPRMDGLIHRGQGLMDFILASETPRTPEEIVAFMDSRREPAAIILTCPYCGHSESAPFTKVDIYICAKCGRTVEIE